jgi:NTE family protein
LDGKPPRWPTIGIKLSALQRTFGVERPCTNAIEMAITCIETMMGEWDRYEIEETTAARTIFIDNLGVSTTDFQLDQETRNRLFCSGVAAATQFVIEMGRLGHVPDDPAECAELVSLRKQLNGSPPPR